MCKHFCKHVIALVYPLTDGVDIVILADNMKKNGEQTLKEFKNRILNIHPALFPTYGEKECMV